MQISPISSKIRIKKDFEIKSQCLNTPQKNNLLKFNVHKWSNVSYSTYSQAYFPKTSCNWHDVTPWSSSMTLHYKQKK